MKKCGQRKLAFLDANVAIGLRNPSRKKVEITGQENQTKKRKIDHDERGACPDINEKKRYFESSPKNLSSLQNIQFNIQCANIFLEEQWCLTPDYIQEILDEELKLQSRFKLSKTFCSNPSFPVTPNHREIVIEWLIDLQAYLRVGNEVLHLAVTVMDLVLDCLRVEETELQALAAASMWLSYKFYNGGIKARVILKFCKNVTQEQLVQNERRVLETVGMNLMFTNPITVLHWHLYNEFGREVPEKEYYASNYLLEIMLLHVDFAGEAVSTRTAAVVKAVQRLFKFKQDGQGPPLSGCRLIYRRLLSVLRMIRDNPHFRETSSLFRKYSASRYCSISMHPFMNPDN